jgi:hypothetical protein
MKSIANLLSSDIVFIEINILKKSFYGY